MIEFLHCLIRCQTFYGCILILLQERISNSTLEVSQRYWKEINICKSIGNHWTLPSCFILFVLSFHCISEGSMIIRRDKKDWMYSQETFLLYEGWWKVTKITNYSTGGFVHDSFILSELYLSTWSVPLLFLS